MPQKFLDLSDITEEQMELVLPVKNADGTKGKKTFIIKDPSVASVMVAEKLKDDLDARKAQLAKGGEEQGLSEHKDFLQRQVFLLLQVDNEVTLEQIRDLPFRAVLRINNWMTEYLNGVFLGDSPKSSTSEALPNSEKPEEKSPEQPTA